LRQANQAFDNERDRRYAEVKAAEEKALLVKQRADEQALGLAREIQTYKDEKANQLREQITGERGLYATKNDLSSAVDKLEVTMKPALEYVSSAAGRGVGVKDSQANIAWAVALVASLIAIGSFMFRQAPSVPVTPQIIYVPAQPGTLIPSPSSQSPQK
jgi:vacuolar-type H+-ATPase subunit H